MENFNGKVSEKIHRFANHLQKYKSQVDKEAQRINSQIGTYQKELDREIFVKVRSTGRLLRAKIKLSKIFATVNLVENEYGISPGQACVFYFKNKIGDKVLGGGWISKTLNNFLST